MRDKDDHELVREYLEGRREEACAALEQMGPAAKSVVPELIGLLKNDDKQVRIWATMALADMGPSAKEAAPALVEESQDTNYTAYAKEALRRIGP